VKSGGIKMKTKKVVIDGKEVEVARIMPLSGGVTKGRRGMIASGKGDGRSMPVFWYVIYRHDAHSFELWDLAHLDQESADGKIIWGRINSFNEHARNRAQLIRICTPKENKFLNDLKMNNPRKFKTFMGDQKKWPLYDLTKYNPRPKRHELDEISVHPQA
jgi:hypothetical protein